MNGADERDNANGQGHLIDARPNAVNIGPQCDRRTRDGRRKSHGGAHKTGHKTQGRMVYFGQEIVFATIFRQSCGQLGVAKCPTQSEQTAHQPYHHNAEAGLNVEQLITQTGKYASPYHVGNHNAGGTKQIYISLF